MNIAAMRVRVTFQKNTVIVDKYGNHKTGTAAVTLEKEIPNDVLKKAVDDQGYQVTDIQ